MYKNNKYGNPIQAMHIYDGKEPIERTVVIVGWLYRQMGGRKSESKTINWIQTTTTNVHTNTHQKQ